MNDLLVSLASNNSEPAEDSRRESARVIPLQEMDSIVDADMAMINHHRLHFYRRIDCELISFIQNWLLHSTLSMQRENLLCLS